MQMQATRPVADSRPVTRPEFAEILDRVRKLRPEIESRALSTAKAKRVPAETMPTLSMLSCTRHPLFPRNQVTKQWPS